MNNGLIIAAFALAACSSSTPATNTYPDAGGNDTGSGGDSSGGNTATISGRVVNFGSTSPAKGVTVSAGGVNATSDAAGKWSLTLPKNTPLALTLSNAGYVTLLEQEMQLAGDADRGDTSFVPAGTQALLQASLTGFKGDLAAVSFQVIARGACKSADGATVELVPKGTESLLYFAASGFPDAAQTSVIDGKVPSGIFYNVTPGQKIVFKVTPATPDGGTPCKQSMFPIADVKAPNISYTGNLATQAGDPAPSGSKPAASFMRVYIE